MLAMHARLQVNSLGKWKTALQMVSMSLLLVLRNADHLLAAEAGPSTKCEHGCVGHACICFAWSGHAVLWLST